MGEKFNELEGYLQEKEHKSSSFLGRLFLRYPSSLVSAGSILGFIFLWWLLSFGQIVSNRFVVSPVEVAKEIVILFRDGYINVPFYIHLGYSIARSLTGLLFAIVLGIPLGLLVGHNRHVSAVFSPLLAMFRPVPPIALIPLAVLWFGIGEFAKIFLIFLAAFLYITLSVANGVKEVKENLIRAAHSFGVNNRQLFVYVIFPESLPQIVNAVKVGTAISWAVVVAAELVAAQKGLGYMIMDAATFFRISDVYVGVVFIGVIGFILEYFINTLESRFIHWSGK